MFVLLAFLSLIVELLGGYPDRLFRAIGHPVSWIGNLIALLDRRLNDETMTPKARRIRGVLALMILVVTSGCVALVLQWSMNGSWLGLFVVAFLASTLLAQRSLASHVAAVAQALEDEGVTGGRRAVSQIVGRDPESLDEAGVSRAAIESLAENFSDGIVAPAFWLGVAGLPGAAIYKAVNTADSMIGHRTPRHEAFGWAAARFDDLINLPVSRLTALLLLIAACLVPGASPANAWRSVRRDARLHRSPNAGWPEAAMAGALGLKLAGPRVYGATRIDDAWMGEGRADATPDDIRRALALYRTACALQIAAVLLALLIARA